MAQLKEDLSDFSNMGGNICNERNMYIFPDLYSNSLKGKKKIWTIYIRLIKVPEKKININNWNKLLENTVKIDESYLHSNDIDKTIIAQSWVEQKYLDSSDITISAPTYHDAKNIGRANQRTSFQTALINCRKKFIEKLRKGFKPKDEIELNHLKKYIILKRYFPMLLSDYNEFKNNLVYPLYLQPKLDGHRCIAYLSKNPSEATYNDVILYTRQLNDYKLMDVFLKELFPILCEFYDIENNNSIFIDGELYKHGLPLKNITSLLRSSKKIITDQINYYIFDMFYPSVINLTYEKRKYVVDKIFEYYNSVENNSLLIKVKTYLCKDLNETNKYYNYFIENKYEGVVYRNSSSEYLTRLDGSKPPKSRFCLKRKNIKTDEFKVVNYSCGENGTKYGTIKWICEMKDGRQFIAEPKNISLEESIKLYNLADQNNGEGFKKLYKGRMVTIEYTLMDDGVPKSAKSIDFRDFD